MPRPRRPPSAAGAPRSRRRRRVGADLADERLDAGSCSPHVRTVTLASSPPTGTSGSAGFGMRSSESSSSASTVASSASIASIRSPASVDAALQRGDLRPSGAAPPRIASPIAFDAVLRSALSRSPSPRQLAAACVERERRVDERRVLALVDRALADRVRRPRADAAARRSCARHPLPAAPPAGAR